MRQRLLSRQASVRPRRAVLILACALLICGGGWAARAQQLIGYVSTSDADITGASDVMDGRAALAGSVEVTARDHTAPVTLGRGGTVQVCQTSALHLTESKTAEAAPPLLFSLDRGAVEIEMNGTADDAIMTPDLRLTVRSAGPLDLRLRVARNGDTCVENRGAEAPTLAVSDPFGASMYELMAGQHVLFEHGSVHEVVDRESEPCGCPDPRGANMAEALLAPSDSKTGAKTSTPPTAHPFPAAISEGLAPAAEVPTAASVVVQPQVTDALSYNGNANANTTANAEATANGATRNAPAGAAGEIPMASAAAVPAKAAKAKKTKRAKGLVASAGSGAAAAPALVPQTSSAPSSTQAGDGTQPASSASAAKTSGPSPPAEPNHDLVHLIGHFFHAIFGH